MGLLQLASMPVLEKWKAPPAHERRLLAWIDQIFDPRLSGVVWETSASQLLGELAKDRSALGREVFSLMGSSQAIEIYLSKLARLFPWRFRRIQRANDNMWRICTRCG